MKTAVTLFSGGGLAAWGLRAAGYQLVGAVEYDPAIAEVYAANLGTTGLAVADLTRCPARFFAPWAGVTLLQASPECTRASVAATNAGESAADWLQAGAICRALRVMRPATFILENVRGYARFRAYGRITATLTALGYTWRARVLNAADYGVPQTRERLILIARRDGAPRFPRQTHHAGGGLLPPWVGWYAAIADLIPTLPASAFAPWQLARLPVEIGSFLPSAVNADGTTIPRRGGEPSFTVQATADKQMPRAFVFSGHSDGAIRTAEEPMLTTTATDVGHTIHRAFLVEGQTGNDGAHLNVQGGDGPDWTITASMDRKPARAWLDSGRVVKMTPRALARFQSVPDAYTLPERAALACRVIGNGVPVALMQQVAEAQT